MVLCIGISTWQICKPVNRKLFLFICLPLHVFLNFLVPDCKVVSYVVMTTCKEIDSISKEYEIVFVRNTKFMTSQMNIYYSSTPMQRQLQVTSGEVQLGVYTANMILMCRKEYLPHREAKWEFNNPPPFTSKSKVNSCFSNIANLQNCRPLFRTSVPKYIFD